MTLAVCATLLLLLGVAIGTCCCGGGDITCTDCELPLTLFGTVSASSCSCIPNGTVITFTSAGSGEWFAEHTGASCSKLNLHFGCNEGPATCPAIGDCNAGETNTFCLDHGCDGCGGVTNHCVVSTYDCDPPSFVFNLSGGDGGLCSCYGNATCSFTLTITD